MNKTFSSLWKKEFRSDWLVMTIGTVLLLGIGLIFVLTFDFLKTLVSPEIARQINNYSFQAWGNWFPKNYEQLMFVFAIIIGMNKIAPERGRDTLQFLLTKPVSRNTVYLVKFCFGLVHLLLIGAVSTVGFYIMLLFSGKQLSHIAQFQSFLASFLIGLPALTFYFSLAMLVSVFFRDRLLAGLTAFILALILSMGSFIPGWTSWSPFYYFSAMPIYTGENFPWLAIICLVVFTAGFVYGGLKRFQYLQV